MEPSLASVDQLLNLYISNPINAGWITHGRVVGDSAARIAVAINRHSNKNLNPEKIACLGYLHDIGKSDGNFNFVGHMLKGYALLKRQGYSDEYCNICLTHSFVSNDTSLTLTGNLFAPAELPNQELLQDLNDIIPNGNYADFLTSFLINHNFSLEEQIISLCDLMCYHSPMTLEARIVNIISRHGTGPKTQDFINTALNLKAKLENLAGDNLAKLIGAN